MRRIGWAAFLGILLALCVPAFAQGGAFVINTGAESMLVSGSGELLTKRGQYEHIQNLELEQRSLFAACAQGGESNLWTVIDETGNAVSGAAFEEVYAVENQLYAVEGGLTGVLNENLEWIVPCAYTQITPNGEGGFLALNTNPNDERPDGIYYVGPDGAESATGVKVYYGLSSFSEGMMPAIDATNGRMGYLNAQGAWAISAQYEYAGAFTGGVAEAALTSGMGFIDRMGNWVATPKYTAIDRSGGGRLVIAQEHSGEAVLLDPDTFSVKKRFSGSEIFFSAYFDADLAVLYLDGSTQLIDENGDVLIECDPNASFDAWPVESGRMIVRMGEWGEKCVWLYDLEGNAVAGPWQDIWMLGQADGRTLLAYASFDVVESVDPDARVNSIEAIEGTHRIAVIAADGDEVIAPRAYDVLYRDQSGALLYETSTEVGAIDASGDVICAFERTA